MHTARVGASGKYFLYGGSRCLAVWYILLCSATAVCVSLVLESDGDSAHSAAAHRTPASRHPVAIRRRFRSRFRAPQHPRAVPRLPDPTPRGRTAHMAPRL
eukprot:5705019-Prymnesium_polylepis.1